MSRSRSDGRPRDPTWRTRFATHVRDIAGEATDVPRLAGLMALFFIVVGAVGVLKPVRNAIALDGLGGTDFYQVYLISAAVIAFVPLFNRLATWLSWRVLFAVVAAFFALNLVLFRIAYVPDHAWYALLFYGWYDLFAAALVTQFFMATQFFFDARSAKRAYPIVIAGGSIGATAGAAVSGFGAQSLGTSNLLLAAGDLRACDPAFSAARECGTAAVRGARPSPAQ